MRILLPPSAGKTTKESTNHLQLEKLWQEEHLTQTRRQLIDDVQNTALLADAAQIFKLGPKNAHEISQNLEVYDAPALAAWQLYDGVLYEAAKFAQIFSSGEPSQGSQGQVGNHRGDQRQGSQGQGNQPQGGQRQLEELTLVFSALFGPVRLTDLITPHRLSGSVKLPGQGSVASIWSKALKELLTQQLSGHVVVDLRSSEYGVMYRPTRGSDCLTLNIGVAKVNPATGKRSVVSHWAKHTRGLLAGALLEAVADGQLAASDGDVDEILQVAAGLEGVKEVEITPLDARGQAKVTLVL
ncbi:MAG: peroxide stress protein YaaA [Actinomyces graevenitzii]|nr:peroxide stress protein YaaA [Actinomyces graevenitzii]